MFKSPLYKNLLLSKSRISAWLHCPYFDRVSSPFFPEGRYYQAPTPKDSLNSADFPECGTFKGTISCQRSVHWKDESTQLSGKTSVSVDLTENAAVFVAAKFLRKIVDGEGNSELYEANPLSGHFSASMKRVTSITDNKGNWTKTVDNWEGNGNMKPETENNLLLTIDSSNKKYTLQSSIIFPAIEGTCEITTSKGGKSNMPAGPWAINASIELEDNADGSSIKGNCRSRRLRTWR
jgi:hypothetical protein